MNKELFGKENPGNEEIYEKFKDDFLKKIKTHLSLDDDEELSKWISNGFDGFPAGDVLKKMEDRMNRNFKEKCPNSVTTSASGAAH